MKYRVVTLSMLLAVATLLSACHQPADDAKEAQQTAADAAVFKREPITPKPAEQFGIGDQPPASFTTPPASSSTQR